MERIGDSRFVALPPPVKNGATFSSRLDIASLIKESETLLVGFNAATFLYSWFISEWMVYYGVPILAIISYFCISNYADMTEKDY